MKPVQYRNRQPLEYHPHDFRKILRSKKYHSDVYVAHREPRKLPGVLVGASGIVLLLAGELIQGTFGVVLFFFAILSIAVGAHFEILNRIIYQYKYFIVPVIGVMIILVYLTRPQVFGPLLPKQNMTQLFHFSSGYPFNSDELTVIFGGGEGVSFTYTKKQLEQATHDSLSRSGSEFPFAIYVDRGKLYLDADIFSGSDLPPIRIRRNVVYNLPNLWDGNYSGTALEIVSADTMPVFQLVFTSGDSIRINGVFQAQGRLVIADESGVSIAQGKRVLFYGTRPIFKYPSWKYKNQRVPL